MKEALAWGKKEQKQKLVVRGAWCPQPCRKKKCKEQDEEAEKINKKKTRVVEVVFPSDEDEVFNTNLEEYYKRSIQYRTIANNEIDKLIKKFGTYVRMRVRSRRSKLKPSCFSTFQTNHRRIQLLG